MSEDFVAMAQHVREEHDATHGEAEMCGAECIVMGLTEFPDEADVFVTGMSEPTTETERMLLQWNCGGPDDVFLAELRTYRDEAKTLAPDADVLARAIQRAEDGYWPVRVTDRQPEPTTVCSYCNIGQHADCADFDCQCDYKPDDGHGSQVIEAAIEAQAAALDVDVVARALAMLEAWAGSVDRLIAKAPVEAVINETGIEWQPHPTPPERQAIRAKAHETIARWLARDRAILAKEVGRE